MRHINALIFWLALAFASTASAQWSNSSTFLGTTSAVATSFTYEAVQGNLAASTASSSASANWLVSPAINDIVVCGFAMGATKTLTVTDNASVPNTYAKSASSPQGTYYLYYAVVTNATSFTKVSVSWSGSTSINWFCGLFRGGSKTTNATAYDKDGVGTGTSTTPSVTFAPTSSGELAVMGCQGATTSNTPAQGGGYTIPTGGNNASGGAIEYKLNSGTSETPSMTMTNAAWSCVAAAFKP